MSRSAPARQHEIAIAATAALDPLAQARALIDLYDGCPYDAAPSFVSSLVGELVLARMRLAAPAFLGFAGFGPALDCGAPA